MWFGDERRYYTTTLLRITTAKLLWFGDERRYYTTRSSTARESTGCGLVMKEDITQQITFLCQLTISCGLVMKEDITQHKDAVLQAGRGCGLVMKEDITQQKVYVY